MKLLSKFGSLNITCFTLLLSAIIAITLKAASYNQLIYFFCVRRSLNSLPFTLNDINDNSISLNDPNAEDIMKTITILVADVVSLLT